MEYIDPTSPRQHGTDTDGNPVSLGDHDCVGRFVGYIDEQGCCWESRWERDISTVMGRYHDAFIKWNKTGGLLGTEPDVNEIATQAEILPEHREDAILAALEQFNSSSVVWRAIAEFVGDFARLN